MTKSSNYQQCARKRLPALLISVLLLLLSSCTGMKGVERYSVSIYGPTGSPGAGRPISAPAGTTLRVVAEGNWRGDHRCRWIGDYLSCDENYGRNYTRTAEWTNSNEAVAVLRWHPWDEERLFLDTLASGVTEVCGAFEGFRQCVRVTVTP